MDELEVSQQAAIEIFPVWFRKVYASLSLNPNLPVSRLLQVAPDKVYKIAVVGSKEVDIKNAISTACDEVEKLADKIAEVRKQMMEADDNCDGGQLEELMDQAAAVSNSGKKLSLLRNAISVEELNDTKVTLFRDFQSATMVQLEAVSQALREPARENVASAMEQETLDQPRDHTEEASTSYGLHSAALLLHCNSVLSFRSVMC